MMVVYLSSAPDNRPRSSLTIICIATKFSHLKQGDKVSIYVVLLTM